VARRRVALQAVEHGEPVERLRHACEPSTLTQACHSSGTWPMASYRAAMVAFKRNLFTVAPPVGESFATVGARARASLDALLSEAILTIAMFAPVSQSLLSERVELHLHIRSLLLRLYTTYQAMLRQAAALLIQERQEGHAHDC